MLRKATSLMVTSSALAITAIIMGGCAAGRGAPDDVPRSRFGSLKDDPPLTTPAHRPQPSAQSTRPALKRDASARQQRNASLPHPPEPSADDTPPVRIVIEAPPHGSRDGQAAPPNARLPASPPKTDIASAASVVSTPPRAHVDAQPSTPATPDIPAMARPAPLSDVRPTVGARRAAPPPPQQQRTPEVTSASPQPTDAKPLAPPPPVAAVVAPPPASVKPQAPVALPESKPVTLVEDQRIAAALAQSDVYMQAGRYQNARLLLQDLGRNGNPRILTALAETFDPLVLRDRYPKLSRTGDPEKAIAYYEQARAKGGKSLDQRIDQLRTLAGRR